VFLSAQDIQIRTRVDLVVVPVSVTGDDHAEITGLTKDDFNIYEDGVKQTITAFSNDPVPVSAAVLIDGGVSVIAFNRIRDTFPSIPEAFSDFDEVSVYRFDKFVTRLIDFTDNRISVATALQEIDVPAPTQRTTIVEGPFAMVGPVINGIPVIPNNPEPPFVAPPGAKLLHDAIYTAADALAERKPERRRIIVVISDGRANGDEHTFSENMERLL